MRHSLNGERTSIYCISLFYTGKMAHPVAHLPAHLVVDASPCLIRTRLVFARVSAFRTPFIVSFQSLTNGKNTYGMIEPSDYVPSESYTVMQIIALNRTDFVRIHFLHCKFNEKCSPPE